MRILWFCNCSLSELDPVGSGTWLFSLAQALLGSRELDLGIIAPGTVKHFSQNDYRQIKQWLVPNRISLGRDGLPENSLVKDIIKAVGRFEPDLVHVWGTENFWGLLTSRGLLNYPWLLEIQGLKGKIAKVFCADLTRYEQMCCVGIKEVLKFRTMRTDQRNYRRWGCYEEEIIRCCRYVSAQSSWAVANIQAVNKFAVIFPTNLVLRQPFIESAGWKPTETLNIFCSAAHPAPSKGLHVAVRSLDLLRKRIPGVRLRIAGDQQHNGVRQTGYISWINRMIRKMCLEDSVDWLGPLSAAAIEKELRNSAAMVIPTFIENCSTTMQEAMAVGTPSVVSYVGGLPSLGKDEESCLFFPQGDAEMCAYQLERILTDHELALKLSGGSRRIAAVRNDINSLVRSQLEIYRIVIKDENGKDNKCKIMCKL